MSKGLFYNRLAQVMHLVSNYVYPQPLSLYLGAYFKENKNLGSRDRKQIKEWFYAYFKSNVVIDDLETELIYILQHGKRPHIGESTKFVLLQNLTKHLRQGHSLCLLNCLMNFRKSASLI